MEKQIREFAEAYFGTKKIMWIEKNGYDLNTKEYECPAGFIKAGSFLEAIDLITKCKESIYKNETIFLSEKQIMEYLNDNMFPIEIVTDSGKICCVANNEVITLLKKNYPYDLHFTEKMLNDCINKL